MTVRLPRCLALTACLLLPAASAEPLPFETKGRNLLLH